LLNACYLIHSYVASTVSVRTLTKKEIEHSSSKSTMVDLYKVCKNHGIYMGNRNGEIIIISSFFLLDYANKKTPMYP